MSLKNAVFGWVLTLYVGATTPAVAHENSINTVSAKPDVSLLLPAVQKSVSTALEQDGRNETLIEQIADESLWIKADETASQLTILLEQHRSFLYTPQYKEKVLLEINTILKDIWGDSELLARISTMLISQGDMIGFRLLRRSLDLSDKYLEGSRSIFLDIVERVDWNEGAFDQSLIFMLQTFWPYVREPIVRKLSDPNASVTQKEHFTKALQIIDTAPRI